MSRSLGQAASLSSPSSLSSSIHLGAGKSTRPVSPPMIQVDVVKRQWGPGKIVHDLIGSSMTFKSFCLFQCILH